MRTTAILMTPQLKFTFLTRICSISLLLLPVHASIAQKGTINFGLDYCTFKQPEKVTNLVELYYAFPFNNLLFVEAQKKLRAEFQIELLVYDDSDNLLLNKGWTQDFLVNNREETRSSKEFIGKATLEFSPGSYKLVASIADCNYSGKARIGKELIVQEFGKNSLELSDLKLSKQVNSSIVPNPKLIFEDDLYLAYEVYFERKDTTELADEIELEYTVYDVNEQKIHITKHSKYKLEAILRVDERLDLFDLADGQYIVKVNASVNSFNASEERKFRVKKPTYDYSLGSNFSEDLNLLKYVATKKELKELKKLKDKDATERTSYLERFWRRRDPIPQTSRNELFEEFSRRVKFANTNFTMTEKKGWQTDRGHVYILLGQPYVIGDLPFEIGQRPRQVWTYSRYGDLIFEDEWQTGDYTLIEGWERLPRKFAYK